MNLFLHELINLTCTVIVKTCKDSLVCECGMPFRGSWPLLLYGLCTLRSKRHQRSATIAGAFLIPRFQLLAVPVASSANPNSRDLYAGCSLYGIPPPSINLTLCYNRVSQSHHTVIPLQWRLPAITAWTTLHIQQL